MSRFLRYLLVGLSVLPLLGEAQTIPPVPAAPPANLQGKELRTWLVTNWYNPYRKELSYDVARGKMYNYADNYSNKVVCVYSGYSEPVTYSATNTSTGVVSNINCEHSIPQSWFNEVVRMRSDMHHLYPTYITWNSNRGSDPFADIDDTKTKLWMRLTQSQTSIPTSNIDEYSEDGTGAFEPREDHKGNLARTAFYFYTMHADQPALIATGHNDINKLADINTLYKWHLADPVDDHERERNRRVAASQGNYNPYIEDPSLVARAWGLAAAGPVVTFATANGSVAEGNSGTATYTTTLSISPAPTAATTVEVALDATNTNATSGTDFTFTSPTVVTFAAGQTSQTVSLSIVGDTKPELDENVVLKLQNATGGASVGTPASFSLTITNDDGNPPSVAFVAATRSVTEGNDGTTAYTASVVLSDASSLTFPITVPVTVSSASTATSPSDYVLTTTQVVFASANASDLTQTVGVTINGDTDYEADETVILQLGNPSSPDVVVGNTGSHTLVIANDDAAPSGSCSRPFFSKYFESATGNTKVVEIFNPTATPIDLSTLRVVLYAANATTPTTTANLTGTLAAGDVYVIANTGVTDTGVQAAADLISNVCFFNGAQSIGLFSGTDTLDVIGVIGRAPAGTGWSLATSSATTRDNSLVRLPTTGGGNPRWFGATGAYNTWQAQGADNFAGVGSYTSAACTITAVRPTAAGRPGLDLFPNPATGRVSVRLPALPTARPATVEVLDALGRTVRQLTVQVGAGTTAEVELAGLPAGLYALRATTAEARYLARLVVE